MNRFLILLTLMTVALVTVGCQSTFEKRINKDIIGINEQLYDLEKKQIKNSELLKKLEEGDTLKSDEKQPVKAEEPTTDINAIYKEGYNNYLEQKFADAIKQLSVLTARFKEDSLIDNALYWQAESYLNLKKPDVALNYYQMIYRYFPFSSKADQALYKVGVIYMDSKDSTRALLAFNRLIQEYPDSDLYNTTLLKIKQIKSKNRRK